MFKTTLKSVAVALSVLAAVLVILTAAEGTRSVAASANTSLRVTVVDLDGQPVHNARVTVEDRSFFTDNRGASPLITLSSLSNSYDPDITDWGTVHVTVTGEGYIPAFVLHCVVYRGQTRQLTVKIYPEDGSALPYVSYVESPPDEYLNELLKAAG